MKRLAALIIVVYINISGQGSPDIQLKWISSYPVVDSVNTFLSADSKNSVIDEHGNLYLLTSLISDDFPFYRFKLSKYNSSGIFLWRIESDAVDLKNYIADIIELDKTGSIIIAAHSYDNNVPGELFLLKFSLNGVLQWGKKFNGTPDNSFSLPLQLKIDNNNNIIIFGTSGRIEKSVIKNDSLFILKYNTYGTNLWSAETKRDSIIYNIQGKLDDSDNIFVSGQSDLFSHDIKLIKYNPNGKRIWKSSYSNANFYYSTADITSDKNQNYFFTGNASSLNFNSKWITIMFDKDGNKKWITYEDKDSLPDAYEAPLLIKIDVNNYINVLGYKIKNNVYNYFYVKYDSSGKKVSDKLYPDTTREYLQRAVFDKDGNLYTAGFFQNPDKIYLIKFDINGNKVWGNSFFTGGIKDQDNGMNLILDNNGFIYLTSEDSSRKSDIHEVISSKYNGAGKEIWTVRSNGFLRHEVTSMVTDIGGNTCLTGWIENGKDNNRDLITTKFDSTGKNIWMTRYDGPAHSDDIPGSMARDADGNIYVAGSSKGINSGLDFILLKYNSSGNEVWQARYNGPGNDTDIAAAVAVDGDENVYISGSSIGGANYDFATVKYNRFGQFQWVKRYDDLNSGKDSVVSIVLDDSGNVYVAGTSDSTFFLHSFLIIKYNPSGKIVWAKRYYETGDIWEKAKKMIIDKKNNLYLIGSRFRNDTKEDITTLKFDSGGQLLWASQWDDPSSSFDKSSDIKKDGNGNIYVVGYGPGGGTGTDFVTIKYDSLGQQKWAVTYNASKNSDDIATNLALDYEGNIYIIGYTVDDNSYSLVKYNNNGLEYWDETFSSNSSTGAASIGINVDNRGNIIIGGYSGDSDWSVLNLIKYSQPGFIPTGVPGNLNKNLSYSLAQNFPNPFNPVTTIRYSLGSKIYVTIKLYDVLGREIKTLVSKESAQGNYQIKFDGSSLSSGVYFYIMRAGNFMESRKMIILK